MSLKGNNIIGIRREDKNKWERRVPLTPSHVKELVSTAQHAASTPHSLFTASSPALFACALPVQVAQGIKVLVQPSGRRIFPDGAYENAGAELTEDLSPASVILAVKEVPQELLIPDRTYVFFSHTIKAQVCCARTPLSGPHVRPAY